jgi:hypothetical protein
MNNNIPGIDNSITNNKSPNNNFDRRKKVLSLISKGDDEPYWIEVEPKQNQHNINNDFYKQTIIETFLHHPDSPTYQLLLELNEQYIHINNRMFDGDLCTFVKTIYKGKNNLITMHTWPVKGHKNQHFHQDDTSSNSEI